MNWTAAIAVTTDVAINHGTVISLATSLANQIGSAGVECRSGGANGDYSFVFTFSNVVIGGIATVESGVGRVSGSPVFYGNTMTVDLTGVANAQNLAVSVSGVTDEFLQVLPKMSVNVGMLIGDTTGNGSVNSSDVGQTKLQSGQSVDNSNFHSDGTADGVINSSDVALVKLHSGEAVSAPSCPSEATQHPGEK